MEILGEKKDVPNTKLWVEILSVSLIPLVSTVADPHVPSWLFLYSLYCISLRDCCFVTFCTIVLAGFVLHTVLKKKKNSTLFSAFFFFPPILIPSRTNSTQRPLIQLFVVWLHLNIDCLFTALSTVSPRWHDVCRGAAALAVVTVTALHRGSLRQTTVNIQDLSGVGGNNHLKCKIRGKMALSVYESNTNQRFVTSLIKNKKEVSLQPYL